MSKMTRKLAVTAMLLAVAVAALFAAAAAPTGRVGFTAAAGLAVAGCVIEGGMGWGVGCWIGGSLLGLLLLPDKSAALLFAVFFGVYPLVKSLVERLKSRGLEWCLKFLFFNGILTLCWLLWKWGFLTEDMLDKWALWLVYLAGNIVFFVYDLGFSKLIMFYCMRVRSKRNQK